MTFCSRIPTVVHSLCALLQCLCDDSAINLVALIECNSCVEVPRDRAVRWPDWIQRRPRLLSRIKPDNRRCRNCLRWINHVPKRMILQLHSRHWLREIVFHTQTWQHVCSNVGRGIDMHVLLAYFTVGLTYWSAGAWGAVTVKANETVRCASWQFHAGKEASS